MWSLLLSLLIMFPCSFSREDSCYCVPKLQCVDGYINKDGSDIISYLYRIGARCMCECPNGEICCLLRKTNTTITPVVTANATSCGIHYPDGVKYKIGNINPEPVDAEETYYGEFPWLVDILDPTGAHRCGGTLIHPSVVLTAAHCVTRSKTYIVRAGDWDNSVTTEPGKHQDLTVSSKKIHEDYNPAVLYNDIALLFLNGTFNLVPHIQLACLAPSGSTFTNQRCYAVGRTKNQNIPKNVDLPVVEKTVCENSLRKSLGPNFNLHESTMCAGGEKGKDACFEDGGGPLFCSIGGEAERYQQVGIVSWGIQCREKDVPAGYTNIAFLRGWIDKQMKDKGLDKRYIFQSRQ